jgi:hypothetical protein
MFSLVRSLRILILGNAMTKPLKKYPNSKVKNQECVDKCNSCNGKIPMVHFCFLAGGLWVDALAGLQAAGLGRQGQVGALQRN